MGYNTRRRTKAAAWGVLPIALSLVVACGSSSSSSTQSSSTLLGSAQSGGCSAPSTVNFASLPAGVTLPTDVALGMNAFAKVESACHTHVQVSYYSAPSDISAGLASGQIQFSVLSGATFLQMASTGQPVTDLANVAQGGLAVMMASSTVNPPKQPGVSALKSFPSTSTWGITSLGGATEMYVKALVDAAGENATQLKFLPLGSSGIAPALSTGKISLGALNATQSGQLQQAGRAGEVLNTSGPAAYQLVGYVPGFVLIATPAFVKQYPQLAQAVTAAELEGMFYIQQNSKNPQAIYNLEPSTVKSTTPESTFAASWGWSLSDYTASGLTLRSSLVDLGNLMAKWGLLKSFDGASLPSDSVDTGLTKAAFKAAGHAYPANVMNTQLLATSPD